MESTNPTVRLLAFGKVKRMMKEFRGKDIDNLERNLMRGMFKRKLKDFSEKQQDKGTILMRFKTYMLTEAEEEAIAKQEFKRKFTG